MEDTNNLLDETSHNFRHLHSFTGDGSTASKFKYIIDKLYFNSLSQSSLLSSVNKDNKHNQRITLLRRFILFLFIILFIVLISTIIYLFSAAPFDKTSNHVNQRKLTTLHYTNDTKWIVSTRNCHIPNLDPWQADTLEYCSISKPLDCGQYDSDTALSFVQDNRLYFLGDKLVNITDCCYRHLRRQKDDRHLRTAKECYPIDGNGTLIPFDHVVIRCKRANYTNVHSFIQPELNLEEKLDKLAKEKLNQTNYYNLIFVGIDTMSRLNMYRQMNETLEVLREQYQLLEFRGYNKVGENTFPNLVPFLSGRSPEQLITTGCWNTTYEDESGDDFFDRCHFLWDIYARYGYKTLFNEDWAPFSTFNYLKPGFKIQPTEYYARPWHLESKKYGHSTTDNQCYPCVHNRAAVEIYLNYLRDFMQAYKSKPYFAWQWLNCPQHDNINGASTMDKYFAKFFRQIKDLTDDRTFVVVFSDHGYRWGAFLDTYVGHQEASLPYFALTVPKLFKQNHPDLLKNLMNHRDKLLTPFDAYRTLLDLLSLGLNKSTISTMSTTKRESPFNYDADLKVNLPLEENNNFTTISMLRTCDLASRDRGCDEAGIPDNYCVCNTFEHVPLNKSEVITSAWFLVSHINEKLEPAKNICSHLKLHSVLGAKEYRFSTTNEALRKKHPKAEYEIKIQTTPGDGIFEEVVRIYGDLQECRTIISQGGKDVLAMLEQDTNLRKKLLDTCKFKINSQSISRLNIYGNQSECYTHSDSELRKMCYCKKFLTNTTSVGPPKT